jgi:hypothetical protein
VTENLKKFGILGATKQALGLPGRDRRGDSVIGLRNRGRAEKAACRCILGHRPHSPAGKISLFAK